mgnify:CR=1 FL=1
MAATVLSRPGDAWIDRRLVDLGEAENPVEPALATEESGEEKAAETPAEDAAEDKAKSENVDA